MAERLQDNNLILQQRIRMFHELVNCENRVDLWVYGTDFRLIQSTTEQAVLHTIFEHTGCLDYMKNHFAQSDKPIILSSYLGLMWCGAQHRDAGGNVDLYVVIGPVFNAEMSLNALHRAAAHYAVDESWRESFIRLMRSLSTVPASLFFHFALMLERTLSGTYISVNDVAFQHSEKTGNEAEVRFRDRQPEKNDRTMTYYTEQKLLNNIRTGNTSYDNDFINARKLSRGIRISTEQPINQVILSCTTFVSLCTRAAIEGGVSPDTAYSTGDNYIQALTGCTNITDLRTLTHRMYHEFVTMVKARQEGETYSRQIRSCMDYIKTHIFEDIGLKDLAEHVGYAEYYLSRKFKEETGTSLKQYILKAKIEEARNQLVSGKATIASIADSLHFCSSSYFASQFQKETGATPQKYREEHQKL